MTLSQIDTIADDERPLGQAMLRGIRCKCPACGAAPHVARLSERA